VALVGLFVIGCGFPYITWKWLLSNRGPPEASEEQTAPGEPECVYWRANRTSILFSPQGQWTPPAIAKRYGFFFDDFTERAWHFRLILLAFFHAIGVVAAFQATAGSVQCVVQTVTCATLCFMMSGVYAFFRPMRWTCLSFSLCVIFFIQGIVFLAMDSGPQLSEILSFFFSIGCLFHIALWVSTKFQGYRIHDKTPPTLCSIIGSKITGSRTVTSTLEVTLLESLREVPGFGEGPHDGGQVYAGGINQE